MANRRIITSAIWEDEFIGSLNYFQRILWVGLFSTVADDQGRIIDNIILLKSRIFPYDDLDYQDIETALSLFETSGRILRYEIRGKKYIQLVNWWEHQSPQWAGQSKYPAPTGWTDRIRTRQNGHYYEENWRTPGGMNGEHLESSGEGITLPDNVMRHVPIPIPIPIKESSSPNGDIAVPEKPKRKAPTNPHAADIQELQKHFLIKTHLPAPKPDPKACQKLWWSPLQEIGGLYEWDIGKARALIDATLLRMSGLTVSDPNSIIKTARSVYAEQNGGGQSTASIASEVW